MVWALDRYDSAKAHLLSSKMPQNDKHEISKLLDKLLATKIKKHRAEKYCDSLRLIIERGWLQTFHNVTEVELYRCLTEIENCPDLGVWAKRDYKLPLKKVLKELGNPWADIIKPNANRSKQQLPQAYQTVHDILKIVSCDWPHLRDKAMLACLYESCCRPHEFFELRRRDIKIETVPAKLWNGNGGKKDIYMEIATLYISPEAKTGTRPVPLVFTIPWLKAWLRHSGNQDYVWTKIDGPNKGKQIEYPEAAKAMKNICRCAGIPKEKAHFYAERHGMATEMSNCMTSAQLSQFAGWVQGSKMPRVYLHPSGINVVAPRLNTFGITVDSVQNERDVWIEIMEKGKERLREELMS